MLAFTGQLKIVGKCGEDGFKINKYVYDAYEVEAGKEIVRAFIDTRFPVKIGDCIYSEDLYITNFDKARTAEYLDIRVGRFEIIPEEQYERKDHFIVKCNGRLIKPNNDEIKKIGVTKRPFYACTLSVKNEFGKPFNIMLIAYSKKAMDLKEVEGNTYLNVEAMLFHKRVAEGHELKLVDFSKC